jgi:hypothetical protein
VKQVAGRLAGLEARGGARPLDRAGVDPPPRVRRCSYPDTLAAHRGVGVAVSDFSTSIHRFVINDSIQSLGYWLGPTNDAAR